MTGSDEADYVTYDAFADHGVRVRRPLGLEKVSFQLPRIDYEWIRIVCQLEKLVIW